MLTIYLLRHGETEWNADGNRYCGRTDLPLTEEGIKQAETVQKKLAKSHFDGIYSSPLIRAKRTAEIVSGSNEVVTDERIIEADFGQWEGKPKEEFIKENPSLWQAWQEDPTNVKAGGTGDTAGEIVKRADDFFKSLIDSHLKYDHKVMVVAHNGLNRLYLSYKLGMPLKNYRKLFLNNASVTILSIDEQGEMRLDGLNK